MAIEPSTPDMMQPTSICDHGTVTGRNALARWGRCFDGAIFFFLCLFAILVPHSIKGAQHSWQIAFLLWLVKLAIERRRPFPLPLSAPLLAYVVLSAISTALSPDPRFSWDRMKIVCLVLVGIVFAQNLHRLKQVRILVFLLVLSGLAGAAFTAWQYSYGIGVRVNNLASSTPLYRSGFHNDDIITRINGIPVHTPSQLEQAVRTAPVPLLHISFYRVVPSEPLRKRETFVSRDGFLESGLRTSYLQLRRGKPLRAQGRVGHFVVFAEVLLQISCLAWAMLLTVPSTKRSLQVLLGITLLALTASILATQTRSVLAGLVVGCTVALLALTRKRGRLWGIAALLVLVIVAGLWIKHTRGLDFMDRRDPGTNFRLLMWEDGLRLVRGHPWFGIGMETIRNHWQEWHIRAFSLYHVQAHFHSDLIQIAVERGFLTLAAWLWFVISYLLFLLGLVRRARVHSRFATGVAAGVLAAFVAWQTTALVHYNLGEEPLVMLFFFYFGLAISIDRMLPDKEAIDVP